MSAVADPPRTRGSSSRSLSQQREAESDAGAEQDGTGNAAEIRQEAGEPTGEMPKPPASDTSPPDVDEIIVDGTEQLSIFDLGGKKPTSATIKLTGGKVKIADGQAFSKGTRIRGTFEAIINEVGQKDETDSKTGQVVSAEQRHGARIVDLQIGSASA